jgi:peptidoglycan/LPS O-acetylase OafA/YrhL
MGLMRVFLALAVVAWHVHESWCPVPGDVAVILFFIISGFYMSMVINQDYSRMNGAWPAKFYLSRFLRLYPVYLTTLAVSVVFAAYTGAPTAFTGGYQNPVNSLWQATMIVSNISIIGLDAATFLRHSHLTELTVLDQVSGAWTLAVEWQYYLIAPVLVTRSLRVGFVALALTLALRFAFLGLDAELWRYWFSPTDWCFFLLGHLSFRLTSAIEEKRKQRIGRVAVLALPVIAGLARVWVHTDLDRPGLWLLYLATATAIPFIFALTRNLRWDAWIGNFSYPIYICQFVAFEMIIYATGRTWGDIEFGALALPADLAFATALYFIVERPFDAVRASIKLRNSSTAAAS